jgi:chemotaxis protein methyltransferase CheR
MSVVTATALATIREAVRRRSGIALGTDKDYLVTSRLEPLLPQLGLPSMTALADRVSRQPEGPVAVAVMDALTTNETLWFRDGRPFDLLRDVILPELAGPGRAPRELTFWSAACSTGQEPYSLAILLHEEQPKLGGSTPRILGTDICTTALARAKEARYSQFEMQRGLSVHRLVKNFDKDGTEWRLKAPLRAMVDLRQANLLALPQFGPFDVVLCRNVLIYFDVATKRSVLAGITARMRPGGWLQLGAAETTIGIAETLRAHPAHPGLYRKLT